MKIQISGQYGDPGADKIFWPIQRQLNRAFEARLSDGYFRTITLLTVAFRVSGKAQDFKTRGPERLKMYFKQAYITMDLVYSRDAWEGTAATELRKTIARDIHTCIAMMVERAKSRDEVVDEARLLFDVDRALDDFRASDQWHR